MGQQSAGNVTINIDLQKTGNGTIYSLYTSASFALKYLLTDHFQINFLGAVTGKAGVL